MNDKNIIENSLISLWKAEALEALLKSHGSFHELQYRGITSKYKHRDEIYELLIMNATTNQGFFVCATNP